MTRLTTDSFLAKITVLWTVVPIRPGEDPSVKTSREELTRGVVITYVDDLLLTGWQHHIDAITHALLVKYVMKRPGLKKRAHSKKRMMPWQCVESTLVR